LKRELVPERILQFAQRGEVQYESGWGDGAFDPVAITSNLWGRYGDLLAICPAEIVCCSREAR